MPRISPKIGANLKGNNLLSGGAFLSFKNSPYNKETKYFMLILLYCKYFLSHATHMRNVRNDATPMILLPF